MMDSRDYKNGVPVGWPGFISRRENLATEPRRIDDEDTPQAYGIAVALTEEGDITALQEGATGDQVFGFIVTPEFSTYTPRPEGGTMGDVMRQGYMTVAVASGLVKANGAVYVRVAGASDDHPLGEVLAEAVTGLAEPPEPPEPPEEPGATESVALPGARFVGPSTPAADGSCVAEIAFNL
jgi:hypothetical protein